MYAAKTKALISCAVTAQLIFVFVFAYTNDATQMSPDVMTCVLPLVKVGLVGESEIDTVPLLLYHPILQRMSKNTHALENN